MTNTAVATSAEVYGLETGPRSIRVTNMDGTLVGVIGVRCFVANAVAPQGPSEDARSSLAQRMIGAIGFDAAVQVFPVEDVPWTQRGKRRLVMSRVPFTMLDAPTQIPSAPVEEFPA